MTKQDDDVRVVNVSTALRLLDMSRNTLYRRMRGKQLDSFVDGGRRKIHLRSIKAYIDSRPKDTSLREAKQALRHAGSAERRSTQQS